MFVPTYMPLLYVKLETCPIETCGIMRGTLNVGPIYRSINSYSDKTITNAMTDLQFNKTYTLHQFQVNLALSTQHSVTYNGRATDWLFASGIDYRRDLTNVLQNVMLTCTVLSAGVHAALAANSRQPHTGHEARGTGRSYCQLRDMLDIVRQEVHQMSGQMRGQINGPRADQEGCRVQKDESQLYRRVRR